MSKRYEGLGFTYLLNIDANAKTIKGQKQGYMTAVMYLAPHKLANGKDDVCPYSTVGCRQSCLYTAGHGRYSTVKKARVARTLWFLKDRLGFMQLLELEINKFMIKAKKKELIPVVRLNGTSDIDWNFYYYHSEDICRLQYTIFNRFPNLQFYDYTKDTRKVIRKQPSNYHLVYSYNENSQKDFCYDLLNKYKINIAVVYDQAGYEAALNCGAIDGDYNDLRFKDKVGRVVALKEKGQAKRDRTGFVIRGKLS